jgi:membrane protease YdiL (CAAX protease family)
MSSSPAAPVSVRRERTDLASLAIAWTATLALSPLLEIVIVHLVGVDVPPMRWIWVILAALLVAASGVWRPARPLRGYFTVMLTMIVAGYLLLPWLQHLDAIQVGSDMVRNLKEKAVLAVVAVGTAAFLVVVLRQPRREVFLTLGDLRAPTTLRLPGRREPPSWAVVGTIATFILGAGFAAQMWVDGALSRQGLDPMVRLAPLVLATAVLNAFGEEVLYRAGPLAGLCRAVGANQAVLMTSVWFGAAHYSGSDIAGPQLATFATALSLLLGKAMIATRGLGWPWIIHTAIDVVIFSSIAAAAT